MCMKFIRQSEGKTLIRRPAHRRYGNLEMCFKPKYVVGFNVAMDRTIGS
jgi:hypothetical protein